MTARTTVMTEYPTSENGLCPACGSGEVLYVLTDELALVTCILLSGPHLDLILYIVSSRKLPPVHRFLLRRGHAVFAGDVMKASPLQVG